jgi:hypothetical protein
VTLEDNPEAKIQKMGHFSSESTETRAILALGKQKPATLTELK